MVQRVQSLEIPELAQDYGLRRFAYFMKREMAATERSGGQELLHLVVGTGRQALHVLVYNTHKIVVSSPSIEEKLFGAKLGKICGIAREATRKSFEASSPAKIRGQSILAYVTSLDLQDDAHRMASVVLCDTLSEVLLTQGLKEVGVKQDNIPESLVAKVQHLERSRLVYLRDEILRTRQIRNRVAHAADLPHLKEAEACLEVAKDFFSFF